MLCQTPALCWTSDPTQQDGAADSNLGSPRVHEWAAAGSEDVSHLLLQATPACKHACLAVTSMPCQHSSLPAQLQHHLSALFPKAHWPASKSACLPVKQMQDILCQPQLH